MELLSVLQLVVCLLTNCNRTTTGPSWSHDLQDSLPNATSLLPPPQSNSSERFEPGTRPRPPFRVPEDGAIGSVEDSDNEVLLDDAFLAGEGRWRNAKVRQRVARGVEEFLVQQVELLSGEAGNAEVNADGGHCRFNGDCESGCCLAAERSERKCAPKVANGGRCENAQIKGGYYADFCPCVSGDGACTQTQGRKGGGRHLTCVR